ncbi:thymidine kinase [Bacteroidales bacterium OttesenSCG-928-B11]|nr:thymidine kinase [Bacteroidales bacterium OttesenSCG-928-E04]MDL2308761.1 thymidine kinase [Bacteroidales bacterium OttesenSCG-928-C03]MDL2312158.1 thymidine kinase [Bacteroidales bacterium OttesenSCG-928-B11]
MFIENNSSKGRSSGWIEVICGSMFSGKTEELLRRIRRAQIAKQDIEIFKPAIDTRYGEVEVVSHDDSSVLSTPVHNSAEILLYVNLDSVQVVAIDEVQFFDEGIVETCTILANRGIRVIVAGLDMDFLGKPFGSMPQIMAIAEYITKTHAICMRCGELAHFSHRTVSGEKQILLGETESYEPLCRNCYVKEKKRNLA